MDPNALRSLLILDWAEVENTPEADRQPAILQRWHLRARRIAELHGLPDSEFAAAVKSQARRLAARQRRQQLTEMARDLAVARALGQRVGPPWRRRLQRLGEVSGIDTSELLAELEGLAAAVRVVVQTER